MRNSAIHWCKQPTPLLAVAPCWRGANAANRGRRYRLGGPVLPARTPMRRSARRSRWSEAGRVVPPKRLGQCRPATTRTSRERAQAGRGAAAVAPRSLDSGHGRHAYRTIPFSFSRAFAGGQYAISISEASSLPFDLHQYCAPRTPIRKYAALALPPPLKVVPRERPEFALQPARRPPARGHANLVEKNNGFDLVPTPNRA